MTTEGHPAFLAECRSSAHHTGVVGGVKNSLSLELSSTGPMASGHLHYHFQTAALTLITSKRVMVTGKSNCERLRSLNLMQTMEESVSRLAGNVEMKGKWGPYIA